MKKSNRTVRKMRSAWTGFTTACLAAALTMSALVSCAPQESRPVVTSDDLTPPSAAQEVIAQEAGGGKNYAYYWQAENAEETLQMLREAYEQEVNLSLIHISCARAGAFGKRAYAHRGRGAAGYSVRPGMAAGRRHARSCGGRGCLSGQCGFRSGTGTVAEGAGASGPAGPGGRAADSRTRRGFCAPGKSAAAAAAPRAHPGVIPGALSAYAVAR